jgi:hypothetical protein
VLGTCIIQSSDAPILALRPESITIDGHQDGFIVGFRVRQVFKHESAVAVEMPYIVPNNRQIRMYNSTFLLGNEVIKTGVEEKKRAEELYVEAKESGPVALIGSNIGNGLVEFKLGTITSGVECEVIVKCGFAASSWAPSILFFKFPLDTHTPSGSAQCFASAVKGPFLFSLRNVNPDLVSNILSNFDGVYSSGVYTIANKPAVPALFIITEVKRPLTNRMFD